MLYNKSHLSNKKIDLDISFFYYVPAIDSKIFFYMIRKQNTNLNYRGFR